jgi:guanylate kinase
VPQGSVGNLNIFISPPICRELKPMIKCLEEEEGTQICNKIAQYSKKCKQSMNLSKTVVPISKYLYARSKTRNSLRVQAPRFYLNK